MKLYEKGLEEYPRSWILGENLFLVLYLAVAFFGMYPLQVVGLPIVSVAYLIFAAITLVVMLRKHLCTNCYYYGRSCHVGWGKLSACMFKKGSGNYKLGGKLAAATWGLLTIVPIGGMIAVLSMNWFSAWILAFLLIFIALSGANFVIHKKACERCKARFACPGSSARK